MGQNTPCEVYGQFMGLRPTLWNCTLALTSNAPLVTAPADPDARDWVLRYNAIEVIFWTC